MSIEVAPDNEPVVSQKNKPDPGYGPVYCCMYPDLAKIAKAYGYALCVHGSINRDFDLVAIPWTENAQDPQYVINAFLQEFSLKLVGGPPSNKAHGRLTYTLALTYGECFLDLSFMPLVK